MSFARVRASLVVGLLVLAAAVVVVVALVRDTQADAAPGGTCPPGATKVNLELPAEAAQVKLKVLNGTRQKGLADKVSEDFKNRGFAVQKPSESKSRLSGLAVIRYGPKAVGSAQWVRAHFLGEAKPEFSTSRTTDVIEILIGERYRQLATHTEVNQSLAQLSEPTLPPGTCR